MAQTEDDRKIPPGDPVHQQKTDVITHSGNNALMPGADGCKSTAFFVRIFKHLKLRRVLLQSLIQLMRLTMLADIAIMT